ncbi:unnamed protein product [Ranitomeya imitator]|uniref:Membrane progestin receptor delta n=1 Tax=Ranitomeya imitator TaxID=111125 RepID=A0ABN9M1C2_9NEOB|nr:unnamed protein product [Ranitomeya imitator]
MRDSDALQVSPGVIICRIYHCPPMSGVLGGRDHFWVPAPEEFCFRLSAELVPDDQRDHQYLDPLLADMVFPLEVSASLSLSGLLGGAVQLATPGIHAARLSLPLHLQCGAHIQQHVRPRTPHLLFPGLWSPEPLQPGYILYCIYILCCAFTYGAYVMPDRWINCALHQYYVPIAAFNTFICTGLSCYSRFLEVHRPSLSKFLRTAAFVHPFVFDNIPLFYRLLFCFGEDCNWNDAVSLHLYHLFFAFLTGFLFASHLPERLAPGRFDYFGHSHQLFHVCAVLGTHFQMEAVLSDRSSRQAWLSSHSEVDSLASTLGVVVTSVLGNVILICFFTATLLWSPRANSILQHHTTCEAKVKER